MISKKLKYACFRKSESSNCSIVSKQPFINRKESGASLVEYGLLVALIAIVAISAVRLFGSNVSSSYSASTSALIGGGLG